MNNARGLVESYFDLQKLRIEVGNRIDAQVRAQQEVNTYLKNLYNILYSEEKKLMKYFKKEIKGEPIWEDYLKHIKGMGECLACQLLSYIQPEKIQHISSLRKYCGMYPGGIRKRGEKIEYNPKVKSIIWKIARSILMAKDPFFSKIYYEAKSKEEQKDLSSIPENQRKIVIHYRAIRKMMRLFLDILAYLLLKYQGRIDKPYIAKFPEHRVIDFEEILWQIKNSRS